MIKFIYYFYNIFNFFNINIDKTLFHNNTNYKIFFLICKFKTHQYREVVLLNVRIDIFWADYAVDVFKRTNGIVRTDCHSAVS